MPGTTSRGYPYPTDTDPIDVAGDMQALAEAIDGDVALVGAAPRAANFLVSGNPALPNQGTSRLAFTKYDGHADLITNVDGDIKFLKAGVFHVGINLTVLTEGISADRPYVTLTLRKFTAAGVTNFDRFVVTGGSYWLQVSLAAAMNVAADEKLQVYLSPNIASGGASSCNGSYSFVTVHAVK